MACEYVDIEQRSPAWIAMRQGVIGSSKAYSLLSAAKRKTLLKVLFAEKVSHALEEQVSTLPMRNGIDNEASGLARWELETGLEALRVGYVWLVGWKDRIGCSPDALVGDFGIVEVKSPTPRIHCGYYLDNAAPGEYVAQMQFILGITGRTYAHFVSFCPDVDYPYDYFHKIYMRDNEMIHELMQNAKTVAEELQSTLNNAGKLA